MKRTLVFCLTLCSLAMSPALFAQSDAAWIVDEGDFLDPGNWDVGIVPIGPDTAIINNGGTATIEADSGNRSLGRIILGQSGTDSGHIVMLGGVWDMAREDVGKAVLGNSTVESSFIMLGGTILYDGPETSPGARDLDGINGNDWEVGEDGVGRFEMHNDSIFRISDDLKCSEGDGTSVTIIQDNALATIGSGISVSDTSRADLIIRGNARVDSGNSMGAGNPDGMSNEGYLTMSTDNAGHSVVRVEDNAIFNIRRLTVRQGLSELTVQDNAQFHIFDLLQGTGVDGDRPAEFEHNSSLGSSGTSVATILLRDQAVMTVSAAVGDDPALAIGGRRGGGDAGGRATVIVRDQATFAVEQNLGVGDGAAASSIGTLRVVGPDADVSIGGDLKLAVWGTSNETTPGQGIVEPVITGPAHATITVGGTARIANGTLKVTLDGHDPAAGESFTVLEAADFDGEFASVDMSDAPLADGLKWEVEYTETQVRLNVTGEHNTVRFTVTIENLSPSRGTYLTPFWLAFHDGTYDLFTQGIDASDELARLAEDGNTGPLTDDFQFPVAAGIGELSTTVTSGGSIPPFAPGQRRSKVFSLDASKSSTRFLTFASMVIPSNDAFIGNDSPDAIQVFDPSGTFLASTLVVLGNQVYDAGTELNDEIPMNTAFFGQTAPDTGDDEFFFVDLHEGFFPSGDSGVLDDPRFANADFLNDGYQVARITVTRGLPPAEPEIQFGAPAATIPGGIDSSGNLFQGPGQFPNRVTAANVSVTVEPGSVLGGAGSNNLKVEFPAMGSIPWTESRHNEGDIAFNIGPVEPENPGSYPPDTFVEWAPADGLTTYAWQVNSEAGVALASVRANGFDNGDTTGDSEPVGTRYGAAYFTHGFRSGFGYSPIDGSYGNGNNSQDLVMGMIGAPDEASFNLGLAFFPYIEGWKGGQVSNATPGLDGEATLKDASYGFGVRPSAIKWFDDDQNGAFDEGVAEVGIPGVNPETDGMLFVAPADGSSDTKIAGTVPFGDVWKVGIRDDRDTDTSGFTFNPQSGSPFSFLYVPFTADGLVGGHISGDGTVVRGAGNFTVTRSGDGEYALTIPGKTGDDGILILSNAGRLSDDLPELPNRAFLSYQFSEGQFVVQSRHLTDEGALLIDTDFYVAWVDFVDPLSPGNPAPMAAVPDGNDSGGNPFLAPGTYPGRLTAANVDISVVPGSVLGGDGSDDLNVSFPEMGPIPWTDARHNEGDIAFNIGPAEPDNPDSYPPDTFAEWAPNDGLTTYAWHVNSEAGIALASVRANGFDNGDTVDGTEPVGTRYGVAYFTHGFRSGFGYSPIDGIHGNGNNSQDLVMGMVGDPDEASFNLGLAFFPYVQGWKGAQVSAAEPGPDGQAILLAGSKGFGVRVGGVQWIDENDDTVFDEGVARVTLPAAGPTTGMLFAAPADGSSNTKLIGAVPFDGGWNIAVRDDRNTDISGFAFQDRAGSAFAFLYIDYHTEGLVGGLIDGATGSPIESAGDFTVSRLGAGVYHLAIAGKTGADGILVLGNAGALSPEEPALPGRAFLSYAPNEDGTFTIQSRHVATDGFPLVDTDFYVAWVDFNSPMTPPGATADVINPGRPVLTVSLQNDRIVLSWEGDAILESASEVNGEYTTVNDATSPFSVDPDQARQFFRLRRP